jgi:quercetin dioxygenase-like cupin family protein
MKRNRLWLFVAIVLGVGGLAFAQVHMMGGESVKEVSRQDIKEKLDGKDSAVTFVEVTIEPGKEGLPHRHPGPGFVYVIEGEYELGIDDQPTKKFKAGETFYEPTGCLHRVSRNPSTKTRTRLIAVVVHPRDAKEVAVPEKMKESHR